jgi:hypothetical protein
MKEAVFPLIEVLSWYLLIGTENKYEISQSGQLISRSRFSEIFVDKIQFRELVIAVN